MRNLRVGVLELFAEYFTKRRSFSIRAQLARELLVCVDYPACIDDPDSIVGPARHLLPVADPLSMSSFLRGNYSIERRSLIAKTWPNHSLSIADADLELRQL